MRLKHKDADEASEQFKEDLTRGTKTIVRQAARGAQREILSTTAFKGTSLRRSFKVSQLGPYEQELSTDKNHASYVEDGTEPHEIRARNAKALRFVANGSVINRKVVHHPGTKPTKFFEKATTAASQKMESELEALGIKSADKFSK